MSDYWFSEKHRDKKSKSVPPPNRTEIESLILTSFLSCPFCGVNDVSFTWGRLVPKRMACLNCGAAWEPVMSYDGNWNLVAAKLVSLDSHRKGSKYMNKMYSSEFWKNMSQLGFEKWKHEQLERITQKTGQAEKVVVIREVVKIRCPYCGGLYDEVSNRCPYCGGKR